MFCFFGHKACRILLPQSGIKPTPPTLEGKVLNTGPPGEAPVLVAFISYFPLIHFKFITNILKYQKYTEHL